MFEDEWLVTLITQSQSLKAFQLSWFFMQFNPCHANARGVFRTLSNIYDGAFDEND